MLPGHKSNTLKPQPRTCVVRKAERGRAHGAQEPRVCPSPALWGLLSTQDLVLGTDLPSRPAPSHLGDQGRGVSVVTPAEGCGGEHGGAGCMSAVSALEVSQAG